MMTLFTRSTAAACVIWIPLHALCAMVLPTTEYEPPRAVSRKRMPLRPLP